MKMKDPGIPERKSFQDPVVVAFKIFGSLQQYSSDGLVVVPGCNKGWGYVSKTGWVSSLGRGGRSTGSM